MAQPSLEDLQTPFDPTAYTSISGAQLQQLVSGASPFTDKGIVVVTTDVGGVPVPPDATTNTKWQNYLWLRISPLTTSFSVYAWNPNQTYNIGYSDNSGMSVNSNWNPIVTGGIPANGIQGYQIAPATITKDKILNIDLSQVNGSGVLLTTASAFAGDVAGSQAGGLYLGTGSVVAAKLAANAVTTAAIAANAVTLAKLDNTAAQNQVLSNPTAGVPAWITPSSIIRSGTVEPSVGAEGELLAINGTGDGYTLSSLATLLAARVYRSASLGILAVSTKYGPTAHGLSAVPTKVRAVIVCNDAGGDLGYAKNDEIEVTALNSFAGSSYMEQAFSVSVNATNVTLSTAAATFYMIPLAGGMHSTPTLSKWNVKFYAEL